MVQVHSEDALIKLELPVAIASSLASDLVLLPAFLLALDAAVEDEKAAWNKSQVSTNFNNCSKRKVLRHAFGLSHTNNRVVLSLFVQVLGSFHGVGLVFKIVSKQIMTCATFGGLRLFAKVAGPVKAGGHVSLSLLPDAFRLCARKNDRDLRASVPDRQKVDPVVVDHPHPGPELEEEFHALDFPGLSSLEERSRTKPVDSIGIGSVLQKKPGDFQ